MVSLMLKMNSLNYNDHAKKSFWTNLAKGKFNVTWLLYLNTKKTILGEPGSGCLFGRGEEKYQDLSWRTMLAQEQMGKGD